jgi:hypothetical protein
MDVRLCRGSEERSRCWRKIGIGMLSEFPFAEREREGNRMDRANVRT